MSSQHEPPEGNALPARKVFRSPGGVILWWVWVVVAAVSLIVLAVQGRDHASAVAAAVVVAVTGVLYGCALRPSVIAGAEGITVANPLREHLIPWGAVDKVDTAGALRVHCAPSPGAARGKIFYSWAVQNTARSALKRDMADRRAERRLGRMTGGPLPYGQAPGRPAGAADQTAESVARQLGKWADQARQAGPAAGRPTVRWAWKPIIIMLVPLAVLVAVALV